jgi:beta-glucanase (GH16 family)
MLPTHRDPGDGKWPDVGEIDLMEHFGHDHGVVHATTHSRVHQWRNGTQRTAKIAVPDAAEAFHVYALEWGAEEIRAYVDGCLCFTTRREGGDWTTWPFFRPFHLILNVAVGGDWGGAKSVDPAVFPQRMESDYVRVYQR